MSRTHSRPGASWRTVLIETLLILACGLVLALIVNFLSPRGLSLTRNYFPSARPAQAGSFPKPADTPSPTNGATVDPASPAAVAARLQVKGLQLVAGQEVLQLFRDPLYQQELIVFVDARDQRHFEEGHIPGAYHFDRYYPERHLATVLPACLNATRVVVYCTGGACEDSEFAALALQEAGVPAAHLAVYAGGIHDWTASGGPIETGPRGSGALRPTTP